MKPRKTIEFLEHQLSVMHLFCSNKSEEHEPEALYVRIVVEKLSGSSIWLWRDIVAVGGGRGISASLVRYEERRDIQNEH